MARSKYRFAVSASAAAVACAFGFGASAQTISTFQSGIHVQAGIPSGLDRAVRNPLEIIWLQSDVREDMWRSPALAHALQGCGKVGTPKEGCGVSVRSAMRYSFDANSAVRQAPIVISSLNVPNAPFTTGRLNLSGSGRVYLITAQAPAAAIRPPAGAILLAAGSTVYLVDAAFPSIQIEVKAPEDQPLFLGNLAESDVTKVVAMLVKQPGIVNASAADYTNNGQVALRAPRGGDSQNIQVASLSTTLSTAPATPRAEPPAFDLASLAGRIEVPEAEKRAVPAQAFAVASVDLSSVAGMLELPVRDIARPVQADAIALYQDFSLLAGIFEAPTLRPIPAPVAAPFAVASVDLSGLAGKLDLPIREVARPVQADAIALDQDFTLLAGIVEAPTLLPIPAPVAAPFAVASVDLSGLAGKLDLPIREVARPVQADAIALDQDFTLLAGIVEAPTLLPIPAPVAAPFTVASVDLSGLAGNLDLPIREVARTVQLETVAMTLPEPGLLASVMESIATLAAVAQVAEVKPAAPIQAEKAPIQLAMAAPAPAADIARMRAEIEAEIARERDRLAQSLQGRAAKSFRFGT